MLMAYIIAHRNVSIENGSRGNRGSVALCKTKAVAAKDEALASIS